MRNIENVPWYIKNNYFHRDLQMNKVDLTITRFVRSQERLHQHVNIEVIQILFDKKTHESETSQVMALVKSGKLRVKYRQLFECINKFIDA